MGHQDRSNDFDPKAQGEASVRSGPTDIAYQTNAGFRTVFAFAALVAALLFPRLSIAFEVNWHKKITTEALARIRVNIGGREYGFSQEAVQQLCKYNVATDDPPNLALLQPQWHFTNETFSASSKSIIEAKNSALSALRNSYGPSGHRAREFLGRGLHTVQDFYSHSNWIETGGNGIIEDRLGREVMDDPNSDFPDFRPCPNRADTLEGDGLWFLTSAYYGPFAATPQALCGCGSAPPGKCYHGNFGDSKCAGVCSDDGTNGVNKDFPERSFLFLGAYRTAVDATEDYVRQIIEELEAERDEEGLAAFLGVTAVGFAIDTRLVGSPRWGAITRSMIDLAIKANAKLGPTPIQVTYVLFSDYSSEPARTVSSIYEFSAIISALKAVNGAPCAGRPNEACLKAISILPPNSELYLVSQVLSSGLSDIYTDYNLETSVEAAARRKNIVINCINDFSYFCCSCYGESAERVERLQGSPTETLSNATGGASIDLSTNPNTDYSTVLLPGALGRSQVVLSKQLSGLPQPLVFREWTDLDGPVTRPSHSMVYDASRRKVVFFGGGSSPKLSNEAWEWNGIEWTQRGRSGIWPEAVESHAMSYDARRGATVLFGGRTAINGRPNSQTWEWDGNTWANRADSGPTAREGHAMTYDADRGVTVLFGGDVDASRGSETWEWNGTTWSRRATTGPTSRFFHAMAYDSNRHVTVLFGGFELIDGVGVRCNDTWEWDGVSWLRRATTGPAARAYHAMTFDSRRGVTVLHGGQLSTGDNDETWEWDGIVWTRRSAAGPSARFQHAMAYDSTRGVSVLFGGRRESLINQGTRIYSNETWEWDGAVWTVRHLNGPLEFPIETTDSMQFRVLAGSATLFDPTRRPVTGETPGVTVQELGGSTIYTVDSPTPGLWSFTYDARTSVQAIVDSDLSFHDAAFVTDNSRRPEGLHGGFAPLPDLPVAGETQILKATLLGSHSAAQFSLVDHAGALIGPVNLARNYPRAVEDDYLGSMSPPAQPFRVVATGIAGDGRAFRREFGTLLEAVPFRVIPPVSVPPGSRDDWEFTIQNVGEARPISFSAIDLSGTPLVVTPSAVTLPAGSTQKVTVTNSLRCQDFPDGTSGTVRLSASDGVYSNSAAVDVVVSPPSLSCLRVINSSGATVLFGGAASGIASNDTWLWNGNEWVQRVGSGPSPRAGHAMAYDSARGATVLFGGISQMGVESRETWEWNSGSGWRRVTSAGPLARSGHSMVYDVNRRFTTMFGGSLGSTFGETWEWNGVFWVRRNVSPPQLLSSEMAYDIARGAAVAFGSSSSGEPNPVPLWLWGGQSWNAVRPASGPSARSEHAMAYDANRRVTVLFGGVIPLVGGEFATSAETWEWDGGRWSLVANNGPAARFGHAMAYDSTRRVTVLFGGTTAAGNSNETWEWDGQSWTRRSTVGPSAREGHALAFDQSVLAAIAPVRVGNVRVVDTTDLVDDPSLASLTLEDDTGAISVSGGNSMIQDIIAATTRGNVLTSISGTVIDVAGLRQLVDITAVVPGNRSNPTASTSVRPSDFADRSINAEGLESRVVVLDNYTFAETGPFNKRDYINDGVVVRISTEAIAAALNAKFGTIPTGVPLRITGVFGQADNSPPFDGDYRLLVTGMEIICRADFNSDGFLTFEDFDAFVDGFESGQPNADFNRDGFLTFEDFDAFVTAFEAGC
ncbi:MAG: kelch repeat-containing protein [Planctomycetota bacterium]|nr:kelch repeat-containing protein [Planctomycetota bacterium]